MDGFLRFVLAPIGMATGTAGLIYAITGLSHFALLSGVLVGGGYLVLAEPS